MDEEFDSEFLISLVRARPVLWDKTLVMYKDRNETRNAWRDVCCELKVDFENMEDRARNAFGKEVIRRWSNLRDAFAKSERKRKECNKSATGEVKIKRKYIYHDQMEFLKHQEDPRETSDSMEHDGNREDNEVFPMIQTTNTQKSTERFVNSKKRKADEIELKMLKALEPVTPNPHMAFFQGMMPYLKKFNDTEVLDFQMSVLQIIKNIYEKRKRAQHALYYPPPHLLPPNIQNITYSIPSTTSSVPHYQQHHLIPAIHLPVRHPQLHRNLPPTPLQTLYQQSSNSNLQNNPPMPKVSSSSQQYSQQCEHILPDNPLESQQDDSLSSQDTIDFNVRD